jgi:hypothetical protein
MLIDLIEPEKWEKLKYPDLDSKRAIIDRVIIDKVNDIIIELGLNKPKKKNRCGKDFACSHGCEQCCKKAFDMPTELELDCHCDKHKLREIGLTPVKGELKKI